MEKRNRVEIKSSLHHLLIHYYTLHRLYSVNFLKLKAAPINQEFPILLNKRFSIITRKKDSNTRPDKFRNFRDKQILGEFLIRTNLEKYHNSDERSSNGRKRQRTRFPAQREES